MKPSKQRPRKELEAEAKRIAQFNDQVLGPFIGIKPESMTVPKPKLPCTRSTCNDPFCDRLHEVGRCSCGAIFYTTDAAHDHECPLDSDESEEQ